MYACEQHKVDLEEVLSGEAAGRAGHAQGRHAEDERRTVGGAKKTAAGVTPSEIREDKSADRARARGKEEEEEIRQADELMANIEAEFAEQAAAKQAEQAPPPAGCSRRCSRRR